MRLRMSELFLLLFSVLLAIPVMTMNESFPEEPEELSLVILGDAKHRANFTAFAISYDDAIIAAAGDSQLYIWHLEEENKLVEINIDRYVDRMDFNLSGQLVTISNDGWVEFWNSTTGIKIDDFKIQGRAQVMKFCPDQEHLLIIYCSNLAINEKWIEIWDISEKKSVRKCANISGIKDINFSPNGEEFVSSCYHTNSHRVNNCVTIYRLKDLSIIKSYTCSHAGFSASFGANGQEVLAKFDYQDNVKILSGAPLNEQFSLSTDNEIIASGYDRSKSRIFLIHSNKRITEWQGNTMIKIWTWPAKTSTTFGREITFSPNGGFVLKWVTGENIQLWQWPQRRGSVKKAQR